MGSLTVKATDPRPVRRIQGIVGAVVVLIALALVITQLQPALAQSIAGRLPFVGQSATDGPDPGTALGGTPAPNFSLTDQFGKPHRLSDFQGKVVAVAFIDSRCTDTCPLTAESMRLAVDQLGKQADQVQLLAVNANPDATSVQDVAQWSSEHGMLHRWLFLTGPANQLKQIWSAYAIAVEVEPDGDITHTPAIYLIDQQGREQTLFLTESTPQSVTAEANVLAEQMKKLLA